MSTFQCKNCKETKSLDLFYKDKHAKNGHRSVCKKCHDDKAKMYRKKRQEEFKRLKALLPQAARPAEVKEAPPVPISVPQDPTTPDYLPPLETLTLQPVLSTKDFEEIPEEIDSAE